MISDRIVVPASAALPSLEWERRAWRSGKAIVAGVDEVGRGAWAGPLVAAAVALPEAPHQRGRITRALNRMGVSIRDSKALSARQRREVLSAIMHLDLPTAIVEIPAPEIDEMGLGVANQTALRRAIINLSPPPTHALVDCYRIPGLCCSHDAIVRGDSESLSIALASIVAKVHRDTIMERLSEQYPEYGFGLHKGYGTHYHQTQLQRFGPTAYHRRSFAPIARLTGEQPSTS